MWCVSLLLYIGIPSTTIHFWCPVWYAVAWLLIDFLYKNNPKYCAMNRLPSVTPPPHICQMWNVNSRFSLLINHDQWSTGGWNYEVIILLLLFSVKIVLASMLYLLISLFPDFESAIVVVCDQAACETNFVLSRLKCAIHTDFLNKLPL